MPDNTTNQILSDREIQVLKQVYYFSYNNGYIDYLTIAQKLGVSRHTIKAHLNSVNQKLNVSDIASAIIKAKDILEII